MSVYASYQPILYVTTILYATTSLSLVIRNIQYGISRTKAGLQVPLFVFSILRTLAYLVMSIFPLQIRNPTSVVISASLSVAATPFIYIGFIACARTLAKKAQQKNTAAAMLSLASIITIIILMLIMGMLSLLGESNIQEMDSDSYVHVMAFVYLFVSPAIGVVLLVFIFANREDMKLTPRHFRILILCVFLLVIASIWSVVETILSLVLNFGLLESLAAGGANFLMCVGRFFLSSLLELLVLAIIVTIPKDFNEIMMPIQDDTLRMSKTFPSNTRRSQYQH